MQNESQKYPSLFPKWELVKAGASFISIPLYVVLHFLVGYRFAKPLILILNALALTSLGIFFPELAKPYPFALFLWAWGTVIAGYVHRFRRWRELQRGQVWHSYCDGISYLNYIRWPLWLQIENRVTRWIEPFAVLGFGFITSIYVSRALGLYLMFAASCMAVFQACVYEAWINKLLDSLDGLIDAEAMSKIMALLDPKNANRRPLSIRDLEGASPLCISLALLQEVKRRNANQGSGPDNLSR